MDSVKGRRIRWREIGGALFPATVIADVRPESIHLWLPKISSELAQMHGWAILVAG